MPVERGMGLREPILREASVLGPQREDDLVPDSDHGSPSVDRQRDMGAFNPARDVGGTRTFR